MNIEVILEEVRKMEAALARFKSELRRQQALQAETWFHAPGEACSIFGAADAAEREE